MGILVAIAAFFQQFGLYIMILAIAAVFGAPALQRQGKWKAAQWTSFAAMVLSGILAFSQITLGIVVGDFLMLAFGLVCCWPMVSNFRFLRSSGFWRRPLRMPRPRKPPKAQDRPRMN